MFAQKQAEAAHADWREFVIEAFIRVLGFSTIGFVLLIFLFLLREGVPIFFKVPLSNLFGTRWYPIFDLFGMLPLLLGSVLVTVTAILIALPMGVATKNSEPLGLDSKRIPLLAVPFQYFRGKFSLLAVND